MQRRCATLRTMNKMGNFALEDDDPVLLSAALAREAAETLCFHDDGQGQSCAWYHGVLPYMRYLGTAIDPTDHEPFYRKNFRALAKTAKFNRILISGTADYCMAAQIRRGFQAGGVQPDITVVDQCETPLLLNRWYAERTGARIQTIASKIMEYQPHMPFDAITTHCFLGYFDPEVRQQVIGAWHDWLRPGGKAVIVNGIRRGFTGTMNRFTRGQSDAYVKQVKERALASQSDLDVDAATLVSWARTYSERFWNYPIYSEEDLKNLFEAAGFVVEYCRTARVGNQTETRHEGPGVRGAVEYTSIVATRQ